MTAVARRPARRPARRRRRYRNYHLGRGATFGPGLVAPLLGWADLGQPLHWAGLLVMVTAGILVIPSLVVFVLFCLPAMLRGGLVPSWRISHRKRHGRAACKSAYISTSLRRVVMAADRGRCLYCGSAFSPQVDHYRPWQPGGLTTLFNLSVLCAYHNGIKLNYWRQRSGYIWYRPDARTPERLEQAAEIARYIRWRRWSPLRLLRAAWALGA